MLEHERFFTAAVLALAASAALTGLPARAQDPLVTYKCPGPVYTNMLSAQQAKDKGCTAVEGQPVTVVQAPQRPKPPASGGGPQAGRNGETKVDPAAQQKRDSDARRILSDELKREEERLAVLQSEFNGGSPERNGDERNYQRYLDRVAEMKATIARKESDIAALRREMTKLPP